jgi:multidrug efflux pump subunit AcrA (membrane-fusion protein)
MTTKTTTSLDPKPRERDAFQLARSLYLKRRALHEKASQLLAAAPTAVQALVSAMDEADARQPIAEVPSSPEASR